jgi:hypothetical protein
MSSGKKELFPGGHLFSKFTYLWMLLVFIWLFPLFEDVVGAESMTAKSVYPSSLVSNFIYTLNYSPHLWEEVMVTHLVSCFLCFLGIGQGRIAFNKRFWILNLGLGMTCRVICWVTGVMLISATILIYNAGIFIAGSWLFFLVFYFPKASENWKIVLSNWAILACKIQFLVVYFYSAAYKWMDVDWRNGDSIHFLSLNQQFTPDWLCSIYQLSPWFSSGLTYLMLMYLTLFPILIWWNRTKNVLLLVGICFHLYTMFIMRLYDFGSIMIIGYILFLSNSQITSLNRLLRINRFQQF